MKSFYNTSGDLVYMTSGFAWNAVYRMVLIDNSKASLIPEAYVSNNSSVAFNNLKITLKNTKKEIFEAYQGSQNVREERTVLVYISIILFVFNCLF